MLSQRSPANRRPLAVALAERRSVASLEFALVAPVMLTLSLATYDMTRALLVWQQVSDAAEAIVENAEKLCVTQDKTGVITAELTPDQMQAAMSTIYAQMPGIFPGRQVSPLGGLFPGTFAVTLSSVEFAPLCDPNAKPPCTLANNPPKQLPFTVWSSFLTRGSDNSNIHLIQQPNKDHPLLLRPCSPDGKTAVLTGVAQFPNTLPLQYSTMINPNANAKNTPIILVPQLVADVQYTYQPSLSIFFGPVTFVASAALPSPIGQTNQVVTLNGTGSTNPVACPAITYTP